MRDSMSQFRLAAFSLVELLVAISLGALLVEAIIGNYLMIKRVSTKQNNIASLNDNMRVAGFLLWQNIMQAGSFFNGEYRLGIGSEDYHLKDKIVPGTDAIKIVKSSLHNPREPEKITFFIGKTSQSGRRKKLVTALYMAVDKKPPIEIVPDITDMKIRYGIDSQRTKISMNVDEVTANKFWDKVEVVMIKLEMKGVDASLEHKIYVRLRAREQRES